ncbi:MAG: polyphosphate kinase 1 [Bdellovibrionales bacterium]
MRTTKKRKPPTTTRKKPRKLRFLEHPRSSAGEFTNREIGWLRFNQRVLHEAQDSRNPLLERVRYLAICGSNLDEFFMKRVGGLKRQLAYGISAKSSDGQTAEQQLAAIRAFVVPMVKEQAQVYEDLKKKLMAEGVQVLKWKDLSSKEKELVKKDYIKNVFPVLTPLSVDPGHPFPFISNLSTSLGVTLKHPDREEKLFARIKVPKVLPAWMSVDKKTDRYISLLDVITANLQDLFPNMQVLNVMPFRITRNADSDRDDEDAEDLLQSIAEELRQRRFAEVVRLQHGPDPDPWILQFLIDELELKPEDVFEHPGDLDYSDLSFFGELSKPHLKFDGFSPVVPSAFTDESTSIFNIIKQNDHLLHHPFESFSATVERLVREAAHDPRVLAIKMTLYRTGDNSPFVKALIEAAEMGKQVVCLIELKARFDEERNIYWAQELESAGVHVVYGVVGLKTHAKTILIVRQEDEGLKCYAHIGTGNYNVSTSRVYTDLGLLTAREEITDDVVEFFHYLTGRSLKNQYRHLLIAPVNMFTRMKAMIEREGENAKAGKPAHIIAKFNNMEENDIALALYAASQKGADIDLIVRGFCCLRPRAAGLSEKLRVISILGRFLEHSRVYYFRNGAQDPIDGEFYIGSSDWMYRNLHARVEAIVPIYERALKEKLWETLQLCLKDQRQAWDMDAKGQYHQRKSEPIGVHQKLIEATKVRVKVEEEKRMESQKEKPTEKVTGV